MSVVFGAVALNDSTSVRLADMRVVLLPQLASVLEIACAKDVKRRNAPFDDTPASLVRFATLVSSFALEKKVIALVPVVGTEALVDRFLQVSSQFLSRVVMRFGDLQLVAPYVSKKGAAVPVSPLPRWIGAASGLIFLVVVESLMAFFQKPASIDEATKLSLANAQAQLRRDVTEEELATMAALTIMRRQADNRLIYPVLSDIVCNQIFAADLMAHLPATLKPKITAFDDAGRTTVPATESFELRMGQIAHQPLCIALLGSWASAAKTEKAEFKKAVQQTVSALAAVPPPQRPSLPAATVHPPSSQGQAPQVSRPRRDYCLSCERAGRPTEGHTRATCVFYRCNGCNVVAPGHVWRNCPNPVVGGPCPAHNE
jgi:hypothetical protein